MAVTFDIRDALLERGYPTAAVKIWVSDEIFYKIEAVEAEIDEKSKGNQNPKTKKEIAELSGKLDALWAQRDSEAYTAHLRGISNRAGEDIISKALAAWPIRRDMYGREDDAIALERQKVMRHMTFAAHLQKLVNPEGIEQVITDENRDGVTESILDHAPKITLTILDQSMTQLSKDFAEQVQKQQDPDFLSKR
jgi:hypothetical protein